MGLSLEVFTVVKDSLFLGYDVASPVVGVQLFETRNILKYTISGKEVCVYKFYILNAQ
jgi:hypothetical protein